MIASLAWHKCYSEIRLLMQAEFYAAAYDALFELHDLSETPMQVEVAVMLDNFCQEKLSDSDSRDKSTTDE